MGTIRAGTPPFYQASLRLTMFSAVCSCVLVSIAPPQSWRGRICDWIAMPEPNKATGRSTKLTEAFLADMFKVVDDDVTPNYLGPTHRLSLAKYR